MLDMIDSAAATCSSWARLHDNVPADLLPRWQKVLQSRAAQLRCNDVPDWVTTFCRATRLLGIVTILILSAVVVSWHPTGATLAAEGRSGTLSCNPAQADLVTCCSGTEAVLVWRCSGRFDV